MFFFFQAEDGIRDLVRSRGLGDVYKRQIIGFAAICNKRFNKNKAKEEAAVFSTNKDSYGTPCLLYTSDAADERSSVDLGGRRIIKKKKHRKSRWGGRD